jgi:amino acid transporter
VRRSPSVVFSTLGAGEGTGYLAAFLVASLIGSFQFYGFDAASSPAEETRDPYRRAPRAIINAMLGSFVLGALLIAAADMAIPNLRDVNIGTSGLSIFGACLAVQATEMRIMFIQCALGSGWSLDDHV